MPCLYYTPRSLYHLSHSVILIELSRLTRKHEDMTKRCHYLRAVQVLEGTGGCCHGTDELRRQKLWARELLSLGRVIKSP